MPPRITVVDPNDWLTATGDLPPDPRLRGRVIRVAQCIEGGAALLRGFAREVLVPCRRRPGGVACEGLLWVSKRDDDTLLAFCPTCRSEEFLIHNWQDTDWADGPMEPVPVDDFPGASIEDAPLDDDEAREVLADALAAAGSPWNAAMVRARIASADTPVEVIEAVMESITRTPSHAAVERLVAALFETWNSTPRAELGGRTPDEVYEERTPARAEPKVGRNAPCPCGSGKKFKRCCGAN